MTWVKRACFRAARTYTSYFPNARGVTRIMKYAERSLLPALPAGDRLIVRTADGRAFDVDVHDPAAFNLMMLGERDPLESAWVRRLVRPGDVVFDIGANYGWYTTLAAKLVGSSGRVHAFEPVPRTYQVLERNCASNGCLPSVRLNNFGLGEAEGSFTIYVPRQHGGASLRRGDNGPSDEVQCRVRTLEAYCDEQTVRSVRFAKCDVEGAELGVLRGAERLLRGDAPPIWLLELNRETSARFGHEPQALLTQLGAFGYAFFRMHDDSPRGLRSIRTAGDAADGENILCAIPRVHGECFE